MKICNWCLTCWYLDISREEKKRQVIILNNTALILFRATFSKENLPGEKKAI